MSSDSEGGEVYAVPARPLQGGPEAVASESDEQPNVPSSPSSIPQAPPVSDSESDVSDVPDAPPYIPAAPDSPPPMPADQFGGDYATQRAEAEQLDAVPVPAPSPAGEGGRSAMLGDISRFNRGQLRRKQQMAIRGIESLWPKDNRDCATFLEARWNYIRDQYMEPLRLARIDLIDSEEKEAVDDVIRKAMLAIRDSKRARDDVEERVIQEQTLRTALNRVLAESVPPRREPSGHRSRIQRKAEFRRLLNEVLPFRKLQDELDALCQAGRYDQLRVDWVNFPATCDALPEQSISLRDWVAKRPEYQSRQRRQDMEGHEDDVVTWGYEPVMDVDDYEFAHAVREGPDAVRTVLKCQESALEREEALRKFRDVFREGDRRRQLEKWARYSTMTPDELFSLQQPHVYNRAIGEANREVVRPRPGESDWAFQNRREQLFLSKLRSYWRAEFDAVRAEDQVPRDPPWVASYLAKERDDDGRVVVPAVGVMGKDPSNLRLKRYAEDLDFPLQPPTQEELAALALAADESSEAQAEALSAMQAELRACRDRLDDCRRGQGRRISDASTASTSEAESEIESEAEVESEVESDETAQLKARIQELEQQMAELQVANDRLASDDCAVPVPVNELVEEKHRELSAEALIAAVLQPLAAPPPPPPPPMPDKDKSWLGWLRATLYPKQRDYAVEAEAERERQRERREDAKYGRRFGYDAFESLPY